MKIYLASSWRNQYFESVYETLAALRFGNELAEVYNFRDPESYFSWDQVDEHWGSWGVKEFNERLYHPAMVKGFNRDWDALEACDVLVLLLPCGNDAHLEAGHVSGLRKPVIIYAPNGEGFSPGLMYKLAGRALVQSTGEVIEMLRVIYRPEVHRSTRTSRSFLHTLSGW